MEEELKTLLRSTLKIIESKTGKLHTLTLHTYAREMSEIEAKTLDERKVRWRVKMNDTYQGSWREKSETKPMNPTYRLLEGEYDSYEDIKLKITELQFQHALNQGYVKSYERKGDMFHWVCSTCDFADFTKGPYINRLCQGNCRKWIVDRMTKRESHYIFSPSDPWEDITLNDGYIYLSSGGSIGLLKELGRIEAI